MLSLIDSPGAPGVGAFDGPPGEGATAAGTSPEGKLSTALDGVLDAGGGASALSAPPIPADLLIIACRDGWEERAGQQRQP